ncbi:hypothetical protein CCH79_00004222 [Gambusia affinis]|uniref:G-protein coupled receptors family 1 profile domain-containing protein n=1 Tax=Gambusia affinis TaxID=33528 RepID=A0A315VGC7_GAMAF|nr:hypothetical protein CCH79_00004222 [Gambusia affinis]
MCLPVLLFLHNTASLLYTGPTSAPTVPKGLVINSWKKLSISSAAATLDRQLLFLLDLSLCLVMCLSGRHSQSSKQVWLSGLILASEESKIAFTNLTILVLLVDTEHYRVYWATHLPQRVFMEG